MTTADRDDRRARADALLAAALEMEAERRAAFLERECAGDDALRGEVEELLRLAAEEGSPLDGGALGDRELLAELSRRLAADDAGDDEARIGAWRLEREIGRGGMGTVFLAERADGAYEQTAALKLLRRDLDSAEVLVRFERERQILASLDHAGIARLLDGGRTADGRPYFVMERVEGLPIDRYCDQRRLTVDERLELFVAVARAVDYAHRNLVVHRDLKPSNIVVAGDGRPKLLDFGIAKLLAPLEAGDAALTRTVTRPLTPEYASPELVRGEPITTASDVYQLGLLLSELLTGRRVHALTSASAAELERAVCERPATRPSTAVGVAGAEAARARRSTPPALARALRGDLDTIVLKALNKEPERRYPSAAALVEDVERHRRGLPIAARADTLGYRAVKFVRRHRAGVAAATGVVLLLAALAVVHVVQLRRERDRARLEAAKSRAVLAFLMDTFTTADPVRAGGENPDLDELLQRGAVRVDRELSGQPEVRATLLDSLGLIYINLGKVDVARSLIEKAFALRKATLPAGHPDLARSLISLAAVHQLAADYPTAERLARQGLAELRAAGADPPSIAAALERLAFIRSDQGAYDEALALYDQALERRRAAGRPDDMALQRIRYQMATIRFQLGDYQEASRLYQGLADASRDVPPEAGSLLPWALAGLGAVFSMQGDLAGAEAKLREALPLLRQRLGDANPALADFQRILATVLARRGRLDEAETLYRDCLKVYRASYGPDHHEVAKTLFDLADLERRRGRLAEAHAAIEECLRILRSLLPPNHPHVGRATGGLAQILLAEGRPAEAVKSFRAAVAILSAAFPPGHELVVENRIGLGRALLAGGDSDAGCRELRGVETLLGGADADAATGRFLAEARAAAARCPTAG
jgi:eukaryotic-like serine/threonine-protein kinase